MTKNYQPDHLGSTSYITNATGEVAQHLEYIAFGETLFEEHLNSEVYPYLFNGKERDSETGLYYYGARYYSLSRQDTLSVRQQSTDGNPRISQWLSVDPLAEKTMTPYQYCNQNPVMLVDPTGMEGEDPPTWTLVGSRVTNGRMWLKAGKGASAGSLASEWNISQSRAEKILENNEIKTIVKNGKRYSNVNEGDIINFYAEEKPKIVKKKASNQLASNSNKIENSKYNGAGVLEYADEIMAGAEAGTKSLKNGGGYLTLSTAKTGNGMYWKPNARGLNNLKGASLNINSGLKYGGPMVGVLLEAPEVYYGYQTSSYEGNKQVAGAVGSVGGGWLGGVAAGAGLGLLGIETGPGVIITVIGGAIVGGFVGEAGIEKLYDSVMK